MAAIRFVRNVATIVVNQAKREHRRQRRTTLASSHPPATPVGSCFPGTGYFRGTAE
jgi:hypothetical protein